MDSKGVLQDAKPLYRRHCQSSKKLKKLKKKVEEQTQEEGKEKEISEPGPQLKLGSYYNLLEGMMIIPQKFVVSLFYELEMKESRPIHG